MEALGGVQKNTVTFQVGRPIAAGAIGQLYRLFHESTALFDKAGKSLMSNGRENDLVKNAINSLLACENGKVGKRVDKREHNLAF